MENKIRYLDPNRNKKKLKINKENEVVDQMDLTWFKIIVDQNGIQPGLRLRLDSRQSDQK